MKLLKLIPGRQDLVAPSRGRGLKHLRRRDLAVQVVSPLTGARIETAP
ncbi:MAG: hypothetical protein V4726_24810 [Verrucomicrobiota bacterium]